MKKITIVSLGPDSPDLLTFGAFKELKKAKQLLLRTQQHGVATFLKNEAISFQTLDDCYEISEDFDAFTENAVKIITEMASKSSLTYGVPDPVHDETVKRLRACYPDKVVILPGVSLHTSFINAADMKDPYMVAEAAGLRVHNAQQALCVIELNSRVLAGDVKLKLLPKYGESAKVLFFPPSKEAIRNGVDISLVDLDRQNKYDHTTGFIVYPMPLHERSKFDPEDLLAIMRRLRAPDGCPWDREQTHQTLIKHLIEEANEAAAALLEEDWQAAAEELGDVFLQLAFHAVVGEEYATFTWEDMLAEICAKLIRRHPHVFGDAKLETSSEVLDVWEKIKQQERGEGTVADAMNAVSKGFPALMRAEKVQKAAASVGFDWTNALDALEKVCEEAEELRMALANPQMALYELGDLLFSCVNTARLMGVSADQALHLATEKFIDRFSRMENAIIKDKKSLKMLTINEIEVYWNRSKMKAEAFHSADTLKGRKPHE